MAESKRSLKQIAKRYSGNLAYFREHHYFRKLRGKFFLGITLLGVVVALVLGVLALIQKYNKDQFLIARIYNPGPISRSHADFANDCAQCHQSRNAVLQASVEESPVDTACLKCHQGHDLHQPNVPRNHSCTACHHEHQGAGKMKPVQDANCASCHNVKELMLASADLGKKMSASDFDLTPDDGHIHFRAPRPVEGYTTVFESFEKGHPAFQVQREKLNDPNSLKFNHKVHLSAQNMPLVNGKALDCASCHRADASGAYMQPMTFEKNCQSCHSLQFDPRNPDIQLPHGDVKTVQSFLGSLPLHYAEKGRQQGILDEKELRLYVERNLTDLKRDVHSGEELGKKIFFSDANHGPVGRVQGMPDEGRARYAGCAYCHEVKGRATGVPEVIAPVTPDRWLSRSDFDHSKHAHVDCNTCHQAKGSSLTSDILMPTRDSCVECHSSKGGIVASCQTCHGYHASATSSGGRQHQGAGLDNSLKSLMLGGK
jgi:hypothetical protein